MTTDESWLSKHRHIVEMVALVALIGVYGALLQRGALDLWRMPGKSYAWFDRDVLPVPSNANTYLWWDFGFAALIGATLLWGVLIAPTAPKNSNAKNAPKDPNAKNAPKEPNAKNAPKEPNAKNTNDENSRRTWRRWAALACAGAYVLADWNENCWQRRVLAEVTAGHRAPASMVLSLARAANAKYLLLATAAALMVSLWNNYKPPHDGQRVWGNADTTPEPTPPSWASRDTKLGVAISGGGIRSASFALGAVQELRAHGHMARARWVTSVSGGSYLTMGLAAANQQGPPTSGPPDTEPMDYFAHRSPEERALRANLHYLASSWSTVLAAVWRLVLGVTINLLILYLVIFAAVRPVGWFIGTNLVQSGLRIEEPYARKVLMVESDPDVEQPELPGACATITETPKNPKVTPGATSSMIVDGKPVPTIELALAPAARCLEMIYQHGLPDDQAARPHYAAACITTELPAIAALIDGELKIVRQASMKPQWLSNDHPDLAIDKLVTIRQPEIDATVDARGLADIATVRVDSSSFVTVTTSAAMQPLSIIDHRHRLDVDVRHWVPALVAFLIAVLFWSLGPVVAPGWRRFVIRVAKSAAVFFAVWALVFLVLPSLVNAVPKTLMSHTRASSAAVSRPAWLVPIVGKSPLGNLVAWLVVSGASITRFFGGRKKATTTTKRAPNARALLAKLTRILRVIIVSAVLLTIAIANAVTILTVGAMNGPFADHTWISNEILGHDLARLFPIDLLLWLGVVLFLVIANVVWPSSSWSAGTYYRQGLIHGFAWLREPDGRARVAGRKDNWNRYFDKNNPSAGFVDGQLGHGAELVTCCAVNILGGNRAPTDRRAASFTVSRSHIGGPEIGWVPTREYVDRLGSRHVDTVTLPTITALSGAAVSPAMGRQQLGLYGSLLAILNVRLGAWLPHPKAVLQLEANQKWQHVPGWPWFIREVVRDHTNEAPYLYVSDGGHWENLALVEALRRGCGTVIAISASGDGATSFATLGDAIEIARTDLGVEIVMDDVWNMRPTVGGDTPSTMPSGRQYVLELDGEPALGRVANAAFAVGRFALPTDTAGARSGRLIFIEASMVDGLALDTHAYAESHPEFPDVSTGDQLFSNADFEAYRTLGGALMRRAITEPAVAARLIRCSRFRTPDVGL